MVLVVLLHARPESAEIIHSRAVTGLLYLGRIRSRSSDREDSDNRNDYEEFDKRETPSIRYKSHAYEIKRWAYHTEITTE